MEITPEDSGRFGAVGVAELRRLADRYTEAERARAVHPDDADAELGLEIAALEQQLFFVEHDNAGAFKTKKLGRRIQELFKPGPDGRPALGFDEKGDLQVAESQAERRFLLVNMGELDRFNKEGGGHAAGDAALTETVQAIERVVAEAVKGKEGAEAEYDIYRFDGNTFAVDLASMPLAEFAKLVGEMQKAEPKPEMPGVTDPAPLTVRGIDFRDAVGLVNHLQAELPAGVRIDTSDEAAREIFGMLRRASDWDLEAAKFEQRALRMKRKLSDVDAEAFFDNYIKKSFQDTELSSFDAFRRAAQAPDFQATVDRLAIGHAEKRFADGRNVEDQIQEMISARARERGIPMPGIEAPSDGPHAQAEPFSHGKRLLAEKAEAAVAAKSAAARAGEGPEARRLALLASKAELESQIESARRDAGTGLLNRGMHYENLERALEQGRDVAVVFVDMGFLKYFDQMGGSDVGDAALDVAARMMEQALSESGVKGEVYRYGGDEFTLQVEGGAEAASKAMRALEDLRKASEPIPRTAKSRAEYAPTRLSFNYGLSDGAMLDELYRASKASEAAPEGEQVDAEKVLNAKAELMTKAADVGIEYNKAYSRFMLLIEELRNPDSTSPERKRQLDSLISFSNKALFAELGGADHLRTLAADLSLEGDALEEAVLDYVVEKVNETRAREKGQRELVDVLLAAQTKVSFFKARVESLEAENAKLKDENRGQVLSLARAREQKDAAEREKQEIIDARNLIGRAA